MNSALFSRALRLLSALLLLVCLSAFGGSAAAAEPLIIWEEPAGSSPRSKLADMNIDPQADAFSSAVAFSGAIIGADFWDAEQAIDTYTYLHEIRPGYEAESYEDRPFLVPYLVPESDAAVVILPGGGFACKTSDGSERESGEIAALLNARGISAFVLHYRANPYEYPIPCLDLQRAVRYLRANSERFHLDPEKLSLLGYSAGGTVAAAYVHLVQGQDLFPADYVPDALDAEDDRVGSLGLVYPALSFRDNVNMLFGLFDAEAVRDVDSRIALLEQTDLRRTLRADDIPCYLAYATADATVGTAETLRYLETAQALGCDITATAAEGQDHGFGPACYWEDYQRWLDRVFTQYYQEGF